MHCLREGDEPREDTGMWSLRETLSVGDTDCRKDADYRTKLLKRVHGPQYIEGAAEGCIRIRGAPESLGAR